MNYSFFPGCVSRGGCPELYPAAKLICERLRINLWELQGASCTGAGVLQEKNQLLGDTLNARTFAMAERLDLPILTICSTCQGVMSQADFRLRDPDYRAKVNSYLADEGLEYNGNARPKHLLWVLVEDYGLDRLAEQITRPFTGSGWPLSTVVTSSGRPTPWTSMAIRNGRTPWSGSLKFWGPR